MTPDLLNEPRLEDIYRDDAFHLLLARDRLTLAHVQKTVEDARKRLRLVTREALQAAE